MALSLHPASAFVPSSIPACDWKQNIKVRKSRNLPSKSQGCQRLFSHYPDLSISARNCFCDQDRKCVITHLDTLEGYLWTDDGFVSLTRLITDQTDHWPDWSLTRLITDQSEHWPIWSLTLIYIARYNLTLVMLPACVVTMCFFRYCFHLQYWQYILTV